MTVDTLVLRLAGPMQSWGGPTQEDTRPTEVFPTRSGLAGLLGACLGVSAVRRDLLVELAASFIYAARRDALPFAPQLLRDFHTVRDVPTADGKTRTVVSRREYLQDARFTLVLAATATGQFPFDLIEAALREPVYAPCLGRRSCVPTEPLLVSRGETDDPLALLASIPPGKGPVWSEFPIRDAARLTVRDVPTPSRTRFHTRDVYYRPDC